MNEEVDRITKGVNKTTKGINRITQETDRITKGVSHITKGVVHITKRVDRTNEAILQKTLREYYENPEINRSHPLQSTRNY